MRTTACTVHLLHLPSWFPTPDTCNHFRRRRFLVPSEVPSTNAFCRTAPSERRSLRAICLAGTFLASDFSWRTSPFVHSRRVIFLRAAIINLLSDLSRYLQIKHLGAARKS